MRTLCTAALAILGASAASAQEPKPRRIEIDGLLGYTVVNTEEWAKVNRIDEMSHLAGGVAVRALLIDISTTRVGLEIGSQRLFTYEIRQELPGQIRTQSTTVAGFHIMLVARFVELDRYSWDAGFGWFALGDAAVPGLMTNFNYAVLRRPRFSIPVGARLNLVFNEPSIAATVIGKIGISIPLDRGSNATSR